MRIVRLLQPKRLIFGSGCIADCARDLIEQGFRRPFLVTAPATRGLASHLIEQLELVDIATVVYDAIGAEPTIAMFEETLKAAHDATPDVVLGLGGGSVLDVSKLVAGLLNTSLKIRDVFGTGLLKERNIALVCLPTTSGTGSEVSPNALLLDEADGSKRAVVSESLLPDSTYVDPMLTISMPSSVTATTGMDALTHCIEAYTNKYAHPIVDQYAIAGVRLAGRYLARAVRSGQDLEARENMALASVYGGLCLGPVNTAAVHALAYPLGAEFHMAHGLSIAVLLPHVMKFNASASPERYAHIADALDVDAKGGQMERAMLAAERIYQLGIDCGIPMKLAQLDVPENAIPRMAEAAMAIQRLLKNNPREMTEEFAEQIYYSALGN